MSRIPPAGSKLAPTKSRLVRPASRAAETPSARRLTAPGGSRLALPGAGKQDGLNVIVRPEIDANLPGVQFDVAPTRANVLVNPRPGVRTQKLTNVRQLRAPQATLTMAVAAGKEASAEATRLSTVGASTLVAPDFRGSYQEVKVRYTGSKVAGELGFRNEEESVPGLVVTHQQAHGGRTESSVRPGLPGRGGGRVPGSIAPGAGSRTSVARGVSTTAASGRGRTAAPGGSRTAVGGSVGRGVGVATTSRLSLPGEKKGRTVAEDVSRGPVVPAGISKAALTRKIPAPAGRPVSAVSIKKQPESFASKRSITRPSTTGQRSSAIRATGLKKPTKESVIQKFDRQVNAEMQRRRDAENVLVEATTSDVNVLEAVDNLMRAEAMDRFAETVRAAEEAAASVPPELAEEAAVAAAKDYQAKLTHVMKHEVPGEKPIQVLGYIGITKPKRPVR